LLSLGLSLNGALAGGHFVVATGVAADGSILIQDPNPLFARANLNDYLQGFSAGPGTWKADLRSAARLALRSPVATRFLVAALSQPASLVANLALDVTSAAGPCGLQFQLLDTVDASGNAPAGGALVSRLGVCDGSQTAYQINVGASQPFRAFVTDLANGGSVIDLSGSTQTVYKATRPLLTLTMAPQDVSFQASSVVNAATFTPGIAPGGLMTIFGTGLFGAGAATAVDMDGSSLRLLYSSPFQVNAEVPLTTLPGVHTLRIQSAFGSAQQQVTVSETAPEIFLLGNPAVGAVVNQDNSLNRPSNPLPRGQALVIYATGLGRVTTNGQLSATQAAVTAVLNSVELPAIFAGLTPGYVGLYQVNVIVPTGTPPGLTMTLTLKEGGLMSNSVLVALQ
jgi:uncharacterized protein (TIGR03437 family)